MTGGFSNRHGTRSLSLSKFFTAATVAAALLLGAMAAGAQPATLPDSVEVRFPARPAPTPRTTPPTVRIVRPSTSPAFPGQMFSITVPLDQGPSQYPAEPLAPPQLESLRRAQSYRSGNLLGRARDTLTTLLARAPHHPLVLTELARVMALQQDFAAIDRLGRAERLARHDSLVLAHDLALAQERLKRPREAARVALEAWIVAPAQSDWARSVVLRMATLDPRGVRDALQKVAAGWPHRLDLMAGLAEAQWQLGDEQVAMKTLAAADRGKRGAPMRMVFADELLDRGVSRDSSGAIAALLDVAADREQEDAVRLGAANRAWQIHITRRTEGAGAPAVVKALDGITPAHWPSELLAGVVRGMRQSGGTAAARELLESRGRGGELPAGLALERALADLKDGPPERALPALETAATGSAEGLFLFAEALFFAGSSDSALGQYKMVVKDPGGPYTGAALERIYLIEDAQPRAALAVFGRIAYESWRGEERTAHALAESLYLELPQGPLWAHLAIDLAARREAAGDARGALRPLLALADSLAGDRLAPRARQRAGDVHLRLGEEEQAAAQYEECLARYPRAWNAPEIRRRLESLRRGKRL